MFQRVPNGSNNHQRPSPRVLHKEAGLSAAMWEKLEYAGAVVLASVFIVLACIGYALCFVTGNLHNRRIVSQDV